MQRRALAREPRPSQPVVDDSPAPELLAARLARAALLRAPPPAPASHAPDIAAADAAAKEVYDALDGINNAGRALAALNGKDAGARAALAGSFRQQFKQDLNDYLRDQLGGDDLVRAFALLSSSNWQELHTALGLALIPIGTRDEEVSRILEGGDLGSRQTIEKRYDEAFGTASGGKGLLMGSLKADLDDDLSGWREEKALASLERDFTQADHLYFASVGKRTGTDDAAVIQIIQDAWKGGPATFAKLEADWENGVKKGANGKSWTKMGLREAMSDELSLESWHLVNAVLTQYDAAVGKAGAGDVTDPAAKAKKIGEWQAQPGNADVVHEMRINEARARFKGATTGDRWWEGAGTNKTQAMEAIRVLRDAWNARINDPANAAKKADLEKEWETERKELEEKFAGVELDSDEELEARMLLASNLEPVDELYLAMKRHDTERVASIATKEWCESRWPALVAAANKEKQFGTVKRPYFQGDLLLAAGSSGSTDNLRYLDIYTEAPDLEKGTKRLGTELKESSSDGALKKATEFLAMCKVVTAKAIAAKYGESLPGDGEPIARFMDHIATRYGNTPTVVDMRGPGAPLSDIKDEQERAKEIANRAKERLERSKSGILDAYLRGWIAQYDLLTGEDTQQVVQESLDRLVFLAQQAKPADIALMAAQYGGSLQTVADLAEKEYDKFKQRLDEVQKLKDSITDTIANTVELVAAAVITIATGGSAGGLLVAALAGAVANMLAREALLGDRYELTSKENAAKLATIIAGAGMGRSGRS